MTPTGRHAWTRRTVLVTTATMLIVLVGGAYFGHKLRKRALVVQALDRGLAAYAAEDFETARVKLGQYLSAEPNQPEILAKYAEAQLGVRPLPVENISQAIGAYRRLLRQDPAHKRAFDRLALLYENTGNFAELAHIADKRLEVIPSDPAAIIARCRDFAHRQRFAEARAELEPLVATLIEHGADTMELSAATLLLGELILRSGAASGPQQALALLDRATAIAPDAPMLHAQRAALLRALAQTPGEDSVAMLAAAKNALEEAERCVPHDPRALLAIARHWQGMDALDRVPPLLDAAEQTPAAALKFFVADPRDWEIACLQARAEWLLVVKQPQTCAALADQALARFTADPYRLIVMPTAVQLYLADARITDARTCLDAYLDALIAHGSVERQSPRVALLQAMVAHAEHKPYDVIALLEPLASGETTPPGVRHLLVDAYTCTCQPGRMVHILRLDDGAPGSADLALQLARVAAARGQWFRAEELLARLDADHRATPDVALLQLGIQLGRANEGNTLSAESATALTALRELRDRNPRRADIRVLIAITEASQGRSEVSERELRDAIKTCDDSWPAALALARIYRAAERAGEAVSVLHDACERDGASAAPWLTLAELLADQDNLPAARQALQRGRDTVAELADRRRLEIQLAVLDVLHGAPEEGQARLRELAAADPQDLRLRTALLTLPEIRQDLPTAQTLVDEMRAVEGDTGVDWRIAQARLWLAQPRWQDHRTDIEQLLKYCLDTAPDRPEPVLLLGRLYIDLGQPAAAEAVYVAGLQNTDAAEVADALLTLLQQQRRFAEARTLFERVQRRVGPQALASRQLTLALETGLYDDAVQQLELRAARTDRVPADLVRLASLIYSRDHTLEPALARLDEAAALGADPFDVARVRVAILVAANRSTDAEQLLDNLVAGQPAAQAYFLRAAYYATAGQAERALADYTAAVDVATDDAGYATLGEYYARRGELDAAVDTWQAGLQAFPASTTLRRGLCKALLLRQEKGDLARVDALLADLRTALGNDRVELLWMAALRLTAEDAAAHRDEVAALLDQAIRALPAGPDAYDGLAEIAVTSGWPARARALALRGLELYPGTATLRLRQASAERALGNPNAALELARSVLDKSPGSVPALQLLLSTASEQGQVAVLRDGLQQLERLLRTTAEDEPLQLLRAQTLLALGEGSAATEQLEAYRAADQTHDTLSVLLTLARLHFATNAPDEAARYVALAEQQAPHDPAVVSAGLNVLAAQQRYDDLAQEGDDYAHTPQPHAAVLVEAATLLARDPHHMATAIRLCRRAIDTAPDYVAAQLTLGHLQFAQGELAAACAAYEQVLALRPDHPEALNNLAWVLGTDPSAFEDQLERAKRYARRAVEQDPRNVNYHDTLAVILLRIPDALEAAREEFERCVALAPPGSPRLARAFYQLAQVGERLGERATVADALQEAEALHKTHSARGEPIFTAAEQHEIDRLHRYVQNN